ncbi:MAG TPA: hypothetical protein VMV69_04510 [Pirellulales bacterium]|nr:hypothetical protein [Pirellulales bacterium]
MLRILLSMGLIQLLTWMGAAGPVLIEEPAPESQSTQEAAGIPSPVGQAEPPAKTEEEENVIEWHTDYGKAVRIAQAQQRMMFVEFQSNVNATQRKFDAETLSDSAIRELLRRYVAVRLPLDVEITMAGAVSRLLDHPAFADLKGQPGFAIIDYAHADTEFYGHVVTVLSFVPGKFYRFQPRHLAVVLDLPPGTLTQRTMVFAVRIHPEAPASTKGELDPMLATEAKSHSTYQARIRVQGHHHWGWRFPRLSRLLPRGLRAQEVVAESWPHEGLVDAAVDCVDSWRHSSGHWNAVRSRQPRFGYDMKRGGNGIWYATGLFGNRD